MHGTALFSRDVFFTVKHLISVVSNFWFSDSDILAYFNFCSHDLPWRLIVKEICDIFVLFLGFFCVY